MAKLRTFLLVLLTIAEIINTRSAAANEEVLPLILSFGSSPQDDLISNLQDSRLIPQYVRLYEDMMGHNEQPKTIDVRDDTVGSTGLKNGTNIHQCNDTCPALRRRRRHLTRIEPLGYYPKDHNMTSQRKEKSRQPLNGTREASSSVTTVYTTQPPIRPVKPISATKSEVSRVSSSRKTTPTSSSPVYTTGENEVRHELTPPAQLIEETDDDE